MTALPAAIRLLTRWPVAGGGEESGAAAFGVVGALAGIVACVPLVLLGARAPLAGAAGALAVLALASGGLHLDGLADTADALAAPNAAAAERARKDPRVGAAGVAAIGLALLLEAGLLAGIASRNLGIGAGAVLVAASTSRALPAIVAPFLPAKASGMGAWFSAATSRTDAALAAATVAVLAVAVSLASGGWGLAAGAGVGVAIGGGAAWWLAVRHGGLDGDAFGAVVEVAFAAALLCALLLTP